jgi:hypothetical protein
LEAVRVVFLEDYPEINMKKFSGAGWCVIGFFLCVCVVVVGFSPSAEKSDTTTPAEGHLSLNLSQMFYSSIQVIVLKEFKSGVLGQFPHLGK